MALMAPLDLPDESNLLPLRRPLTVHEARSIVGVSSWRSMDGSSTLILPMPTGSL